MALAKLIPQTKALLRAQLPALYVPTTTYSSDVPKNIPNPPEMPPEKRTLWWKLFGWTVKEYDEEGNELGCPRNEDLAVGMWKKEIDAYASGNEDPYGIAAIDRANQGTKIDPIRVHSAFESRLVACKCHPDDLTVIPIWLHQNEPKRCRCGYWMVLYYKPPFVDFDLCPQ